MAVSLNLLPILNDIFVLGSEMLLYPPSDAAAEWTLPGVYVKLSGVGDAIDVELWPLRLFLLGRGRTRRVL